MPNMSKALDSIPSTQGEKEETMKQLFMAITQTKLTERYSRNKVKAKKQAGTVRQKDHKEVEHVPGMLGAPGSIPNTAKNLKKQQQQQNHTYNPSYLGS